MSRATTTPDTRRPTTDPVGALGSILGIWAHPDDEAYLMAGVMAMAVAAGQPVACVTATLGDAGETADPQRWPREHLRDIRRAELDSALAVLGVDDHECLHLPDGQLAQLDDPATQVERLAAVIERHRPETVITFGPDGMTGHPDHVVVSEWTQDAVARVSPRPRVLFATKTQDWAEAFARINAEVFPPGLPPRTPSDQALCIELDETTLARKVAALDAHASQTTGLSATLGRDTYAEWVRLEAFRPVG